MCARGERGRSVIEHFGLEETWCNVGCLVGHDVHCKAVDFICGDWLTVDVYRTHGANDLHAGTCGVEMSPNLSDTEHLRVPSNSNVAVIPFAVAPDCVKRYSWVILSALVHPDEYFTLGSWSSTMNAVAL